MTPGVIFALLGCGVGALVIAGRPETADGRRGERGSTSPRERADALRARTVEAQIASARMSLTARELAEQWSRAEDEARKMER